jgi:SCY1-like protein 2
LDKFTLTETLVPLLARIKTKEPSVMIATLAVHEQIGLKCDIQAIATLVLPQLWAMSITPLLSAEQFRRFMNVIKQLGTRVEEEHSRHLAEIKRLEDSNASHRRTSTLDADGTGEVDFASLVRGPSSTGSAGSKTPDPFGADNEYAQVC